MTLRIANLSSHLRTSRTFPTDSQALSVEISKAYLDIANNVNTRTIGIYATVPSITGNVWYLAGSPSGQSTIRKVYTFTGTGNVAHGIDTTNIGGFVRIYGTFRNASSPATWYPLPYVDVTNANNQVSVSVTSTNIVITAGGGAPPTVSSGYVVLEFLSQP